MVVIPAPDRIDLGALVLVLVFLFVGYVLYPTHLVQVSVWLSILTVFICWTGYVLYRMVYDEVEFWE